MSELSDRIIQLVEEQEVNAGHELESLRSDKKPHVERIARLAAALTEAMEAADAVAVELQRIHDIPDKLECPGDERCQPMRILRDYYAARAKAEGR